MDQPQEILEAMMSRSAESEVIHLTEPALWSMFRADHGFLPNQVEYLKGLGEASSLSEVEEVVSHLQVRAVGLVIDKVDKIMNGMELGMDGMHILIAGLGLLAAHHGYHQPHQKLWS